MIDPFDVSNATVGEPLGIVVGQSTQWQREIAIDPSLFTLKYVLRRHDPATATQGEDLSAQSIDMESIGNGCFGVDIVAADSVGWITGRFYWDLTVVRISDDRERVLDTGEFNIFDSATDRRSHAQIMIQKIESLLNKRADADVETYSIKSRSITKMSAADLREWRDYYMRELEAQQPTGADVFQSQQVNKSTIKVRFTN